MRSMIRRLAAVLTPWRCRCARCQGALAPGDVYVCEPCMTSTSDAIIRARIAELTTAEAVGLARGVALRDGERELAAALQAVLLLHLTGGSLTPVAALVQPERPREAVN